MEQVSTASVDLSVVIPTYNGARTIADCLRSVDKATAGRQREIIVADSSTDGTPEIVRRSFPEVTLIRSAQRLSAGAARNRGAAAASGRLIFFTDQDCVVPEDWVERMEGHFRDPTVHGAGGSVAIRNSWSASGCAIYFLEFLNHFPGNGPKRRDVGFLVGCNAAYRAEVIRAECFPDQTLGEDVLFAHHLRTRGLQTVYDPSLAVLHQNREGWTEFFRYNCKMGRAAAEYQAVLGRWWTAPFRHHPLLVYAAPLAILPTIFLYLLRSNPRYLVRFLALAPVCLLGNLVWADGFRQRTMEVRGRKAIRLGVEPPSLDTQLRTPQGP